METTSQDVPGDMRALIQERLSAVEREHDVRVVFACESGSRAWGIASQDSDYDVRFLYVNRPQWYLSIDERRDVIELPIEGDLDINGWDLKKALARMRKSNPPLLEWLGSPIVYRELPPAATWIREMVPVCYSPRACLHHYLSMARKQVQTHLTDERVVRKKYLYALRPMVVVRWIERGLGVVPTRFETAVDAVVDDPSVREAIDRLLRDKRAGREMDEGPRIPVLSDFLARELERAQEHEADVETSAAEWERLNGVFRAALEAAWRQNP